MEPALGPAGQRVGERRVRIRAQGLPVHRGPSSRAWVGLIGPQLSVGYFFLPTLVTREVPSGTSHTSYVCGSTPVTLGDRGAGPAPCWQASHSTHSDP